MRGEVLHYDEAHGFGFITGADGSRYTFRREDLRQAFLISKGMPIDFRESGSEARDISPIGGTAAAPPKTAPSAQAMSATAAAPVNRPQHFGRFAVPPSDLSTGTGLWDYFRAGMTKNYVNFRDRARRKEYWGFVLFFYLGLIALSLAGVWIDYSFGNMEPGYEMPVATITLATLFVLAGILPSLAMSIRRQHDIGLSGWFFLLVFIPYIGNLILFVFALIPSQKHENKWGPVPLGITIPPPYDQPTPAVPTSGTGQ